MSGVAQATNMRCAPYVLSVVTCVANVLDLPAGQR
jgi:hypothetical protein